MTHILDDDLERLLQAEFEGWTNIDTFGELGNVDLMIERLNDDIRNLENQMRQEEEEHRLRQNFLAEKANLGQRARVNWIKEGF